MLAVVLITVFGLPAFSPAQDLARRLILKDGSYQLVTKYETKGDRVRYLSAERNEWEELPESLVDWPATEKYEKERVAGAALPEAVHLDKDIEAERAREERLLPQVAPGLRLPQDSGVFLLDSFQGEPQIVELQQTAGDVSQNTKGNIFRDAINPIAGLKQAIVLDGPHAQVQSHVEVPSLYINYDDAPDQASQSGQPATAKDSAHNSSAPQQPQQSQQPITSDRFRIIRTDVKNGKRILGDVKRQVNGKISQEQHLVKTTVTPIGSGWLKVTPTEPLPLGEYALAEMTPMDSSGKAGINLYVWDFGVNAKAPANANTWKPSSPETKSDSAAGPH
jgi:hypothetical protein